MSTSSPSRKEVVRLPAAIEPEHPRTRICMAGIVEPGWTLTYRRDGGAVTECTPGAAGRRLLRAG
jgi:hypothetical protein